MTRFFSTLSIAALLCFSSVLPAQETFTDSAQWQAAICGSVVTLGETDLTNFPPADVSGEASAFFSGPLTFSFGDLAASSSIQVFPDSTQTQIIGLLFGPGVNLTITPDPNQGNVEGFCFDFGGDVDITIFDGANVVDTFSASGPTNTATGGTICWLNSGQANVTSVQVVSTGGELLTIGGTSAFAFGDGCDTEPTCQDSLQDVIDSLYVKLGSATGCDIDWIQCAIDELECAQDPILWATEDRLSDYGCSFFQKNFYATYYLECVSDSALVEDCLIGIQDLLGCVVDAEIDYALENPNANTNLLAYAECFEDYADAFADCEMYLNAVILHFYAWLFANNA